MTLKEFKAAHKIKTLSFSKIGEPLENGTQFLWDKENSLMKIAGQDLNNGFIVLEKTSKSNKPYLFLVAEAEIVEEY